MLVLVRVLVREQVLQHVPRGLGLRELEQVPEPKRRHILWLR